ncbi:D-2-hydroxyacid dehydrogenase [Alteromonas sp. PRIM-21]|uniref:D-2-hydroxyacid dehydrogenase n=1 Tax=Alteromonas sp. PRIM-21 TaxID=1454978 RepID=UPI003FA4701B|nr:D-2-hydroxyacid dehydrogenase [Alteromonas sp. PRIM-21]
MTKHNTSNGKIEDNQTQSSRNGQKKRVVFLDAETMDLSSLDTSVLDSLNADVTLYQQTDAEEVGERIRAADAVLVNKVVLNAEDLKLAEQLKYIGVTATGMNNIDHDYCKQAGISVQNVEGYGTDSVAQHALTLLLNLATNFVAYQRDMDKQAWSASSHFCLLNHPVIELAGKHAVIVGHGELGKRVEALFKAMGMKVSIAARPGKQDDPRPSLTSLLPDADVISLHCPLTEDTEKLINADTLSLMRPTAFLINTARGGLVDEKALYHALKHNKIGGAGLDVLSVEPPPVDHILLKEPLPNLLVSPHNAWIGNGARQKLLDKALAHLTEFLG